MSRVDDDDADERPDDDRESGFGRSRRGSGLERALRDLDRFFVDLGRGLARTPGTWRYIAWGAAALLALVAVFNSLYQVQPEEVGVVVRFGRYVRTTEPGLRAKIPFVEQVFRIPVQRQLKEEFGFRTTEAAVRSSFTNTGYGAESMMLTGDLNVAVVEWIVQYRVADPYLYLFKVRNITDTFRAMNEAVMRQVVGDRTVTEVLTVGRQAVESRAEELLKRLTQQYEMGITVEQVVLQDVNPPDPVKPSWDEVNQAQQQRDRMINEARAEYNKIIPRAKGEAQQTVLEAEGYSLNRINRAQGESARFRSVQEAYRRAPEVTRRRLYLETIERVLPKVGGKLVVDPNARGVLPLLPLNALQPLTAGAADAGAAASAAPASAGGGGH